jgi:hypothetical protein
LLQLYVGFINESKIYQPFKWGEPPGESCGSKDLAQLDGAEFRNKLTVITNKC